MSEKKDFSKPLVMWYLKNKRDLPWRKSSDPYRIWLSEIILQQTRIAQGRSYYEKFVEEFEDIFGLAEANEEKVLKLWQGLGYYSRARNLHETARHIASELKGKFPVDYRGLLQLKGVGEYTASAIASMAYGLPHATVDGNVYRVLSRYFGIETPIDTSKGMREFKSLAQELLDSDQPGTHNQALMELGALVCTPKSTRCEQCPLKKRCFARLAGRIDEFPIKQGKIKTRKRFFNYLVLDTPDQFTKIRQRTGSDIWKHLYEFPMRESDTQATDLPGIDSIVAEEFDLKSGYELRKFNSSPVIHKLSHQELHADFWIIHTEERPQGTIPWDELSKYALPVLLQKFVDKYKPSS